MVTLGSPLRPSDVALRAAADTLRRVATYRLPPAIDRRLTHLAESKDELSPEQRDELLALVELSEGRTIEKLQAIAALRRLAGEFPDIVGEVP